MNLLVGPEQIGAVTGCSLRQWWSRLGLRLVIAGHRGPARILLGALALLHVVEHVIDVGSCVAMIVDVVAHVAIGVSRW